LQIWNVEFIFNVGNSIQFNEITQKRIWDRITNKESLEILSRKIWRFKTPALSLSFSRNGRAEIVLVRCSSLLDTRPFRATWKGITRRLPSSNAGRGLKQAEDTEIISGKVFITSAALCDQRKAAGTEQLSLCCFHLRMDWCAKALWHGKKQKVTVVTRRLAHSPTISVELRKWSSKNQGRDIALQRFLITQLPMNSLYK